MAIAGHGRDEHPFPSQWCENRDIPWVNWPTWQVAMEWSHPHTPCWPSPGSKMGKETSSQHESSVYIVDPWIIPTKSGLIMLCMRSSRKGRKGNRPRKNIRRHLSNRKIQVDQWLKLKSPCYIHTCIYIYMEKKAEVAWYITIWITSEQIHCYVAGTSSNFWVHRNSHWTQLDGYDMAIYTTLSIISPIIVAWYEALSKKNVYPLVIEHSYWKWPFMVDVPRFTY